jgi:hypothetical protein
LKNRLTAFYALKILKMRQNIIIQLLFLLPLVVISGVDKPGKKTQQNIIKIDSLELIPGETAIIPIIIQNDDLFISFQLDIPIPEGFVYVPGSVQLNPDRRVNPSISANVLANGRLRILSYSLSNTPFLGNDGPVAWFSLESVHTPGEYLLQVLNATIGSPNSQNIITGTESGILHLVEPLAVLASSTSSSICEGSSVVINAAIEGGGWFPEINWTSAPPGFFSSQANPVVNPQVSTSYFVVVNDGLQLAYDTVDIFVQPAPLAFAGDDQVIEAGASVSMSQAIAGNFNSVLWLTSGDGSFSNAAIVNTIYYPGEADIQNGELSLELQVNGISPCGQVSDVVNVIILSPEDNVLVHHDEEGYIADTLTLNLEIINTTAFTSFGCTIQLPDGMEYLSESAVLSERANDHIFEAVVEPGNLLSFFVFSENNSLFSGNAGIVLSYKLITGNQSGIFPLHISEAFIYDLNQTNVLTRTYDGEINILLSNAGFIIPDQSLTALIYPLPATSGSVLQLQSSQPSRLSLALYNSMGLMLNENNILLPDVEKEVMLEKVFPGFSALPAGIYFCVINTLGITGRPIVLRIIK